MKLFIVTGCSGSGKSTLAKELAKKIHDFDVLDFDDLGVPSDLTSFQQWMEWRIERTNILLDSMIRQTIICGSIMPYEFFRFNNRQSLEVRIALLTLTPSEITHRLVLRQWDEDLINSNIRLTSHLNWEITRELNGIKIDTEDNSIEESAVKLINWIKGD